MNTNYSVDRGTFGPMKNPNNVNTPSTTVAGSSAKKNIGQN